MFKDIEKLYYTANNKDILCHTFYANSNKVLFKDAAFVEKVKTAEAEEAFMYSNIVIVASNGQQYIAKAFKRTSATSVTITDGANNTYTAND